MKKILLSGAVVCASILANAQGISETAAYDDFKKASEFSDLYSVKTTELAFPACTDLDTAYMGIFTYEDKDEALFKVTQTRNMVDGQLELDLYQGYGSYEPFGFIFGSYCEGTSEGMFTLDLSQNAMLSFSVTAEEVVLGDDSQGDPTPEEGVQMKIQVEDINGVSLVFDKSAIASEQWKYEIGITGDGTKPSNFGPTGLSDGANQFLEGETVLINYDLKNAIPADANGNVVTDGSIEFDYTQVKAIKLTFASNHKDRTDDLYNPYEHDAIYIIKDLKIGDVSGLSNEIMAPTALSAADASTDTPAIDLTWTDNSENEENFVVYRKVMGETTYNLIETLDANITTYTDTDVDFDVEYMYQIAAKAGTNEALSNEAMVTPVGFADDIVKLKANIYPNPATSTLNFSEELEGVVIYNSKGTVMFSAAKAKNVNVAEFNKGIYFLQTSKGSKSFVVE